MRHVPALDGVRGVAILAVVVCHVAAYTGRSNVISGYQGVNVFFVLSGYLITSLLLEEWRKRDTINLPNFYRRRFARLMPALMVAAVGYTAFSVYVNENGLGASAILGDLPWVLLYVSNLRQSVAPGFTGAGHAWSLAIEEQFYLAWPLLILAILARPKWVRITVAVSIGAVALAEGLRLMSVVLGWDGNFVYYFPLGRADSLAIGCLAAIWSFNGGRLSRPGWTVILAAIAMFSPLMVAYPPEFRLLDLITYPVVNVATALIILGAVQHQAGLGARVLASRPLIYLGAISYSLYLWHLFAFNAVAHTIGMRLLTVPLALLLAWVLAELSYRLVEKPLRARLSGRRPADPVAPPAPAESRIVAGGSE